jgi:hypothetical protein
MWSTSSRRARPAAGPTGRRRRGGDPARTRRRAKLYQGDFLAEEPYAGVGRGAAGRAALQAVDLQSRLVELYIDGGGYGPAALLGRRILAIDPCNEAVHRRLMVCYAAAGMRHLALAQYDRLTGGAVGGLPGAPVPETVELYERLRRRAIRSGVPR